MHQKSQEGAATGLDSDAASNISKGPLGVVLRPEDRHPFPPLASKVDF